MMPLFPENEIWHRCCSVPTVFAPTLLQRFDFLLLITTFSLGVGEHEVETQKDFLSCSLNSIPKN